MSIHTILSQMEEELNKTKFAKGGGACFECCDYEEMYVELKELYKLFATRIVEEVVKELIGEDEVIDPNTNSANKIHFQGRNELRAEQRAKLQKMKGEI